MLSNTALTSPESKKSKFFYGYVVVIASFFAMVILYVVHLNFGIFLKPITADFGWTRAMTSGSFSMNLLVFGLLCMATGRLSDRFGPRVVVTICGFFFGLGVLLMSQISSLWQLYLYYGVIVAIGLSGGYVPLCSTVAKWFVKRRGIMTSIAASGVGAGTIVGPHLVSWLITNHGWRAAYSAMGITALVLLIVVAQFLRRAPSPKGQLPHASKKTKNNGLVLEEAGFFLHEAIRTRQLWILCIIYVLYGVSNMAVVVHIVPHATDLGFSTITSANIMTIIGATNLIGRIGMGGASDRVGNSAALIIGFIIQFISLLLLLFAKELWMFYLFAPIFGFSFGGIVVLIAPAAAEFFGLRAHGVIMGMLTFGANLGAAVGPLLAGHIFDTTNSYQAAFMLYAILSAMGLALSLLLRQIHGQELMHMAQLEHE